MGGHMRTSYVIASHWEKSITEDYFEDVNYYPSKMPIEEPGLVFQGHEPTIFLVGADVPRPRFTRSRATISELFSELRDEWQRDCRTSATSRRIALHPAYQRIIGLGLEALPLIFAEMRQQPDHWFWALTAIVGEDIAAGAEDIETATTAWLNWAKSHGYQT